MPTKRPIIVTISVETVAELDEVLAEYAARVMHTKPNRSAIFEMLATRWIAAAREKLAALTPKPKICKCGTEFSSSLMVCPACGKVVLQNEGVVEHGGV